MPGLAFRIIFSQQTMLSCSKANAKYIKCKREPTYLLPFVPHGEDVLTWLPSGLKETGNWLRVTYSVDQAPQILGAAIIV